MIEFNKVSKCYKGEPAVANFSLKCSPSKCHFLVGKNGSGKSTLFNLSSGLISLDSGQIKIQNKIIDGGHRDVLKNVGFVLETPLYNEQFTSFEHLRFLNNIYKINDYNRVEWLIDFFELPKDKKRIHEYSTGMKSKVSLASAMINDPKIMILDEPFSGMDIKIIEKLLRFFKTSLTQGITILISSHNMHVIEFLADTITLIKEGQNIGSYATSEVLNEDISKYIETNI